MTVTVYYQGLRRPARLKGARFIGGEIFVSAMIAGFKIEKLIRWNDILKVNSTQIMRAA